MGFEVIEWRHRPGSEWLLRVLFIVSSLVGKSNEDGMVEDCEAWKHPKIFQYIFRLRIFFLAGPVELFALHTYFNFQWPESHTPWEAFGKGDGEKGGRG